jgi:hypothetical protein
LDVDLHVAFRIDHTARYEVFDQENRFLAHFPPSTAFFGKRVVSVKLRARFARLGRAFYFVSSANSIRDVGVDVGPNEKSGSLSVQSERVRQCQRCRCRVLT